jgi:2-dehydro-3-deoxygluconokinase
VTRTADTSRFDFTTTGEVMLRYSVPAGTRLETAAALDVTPGGAEANVAALLARLGRRAAWAGALPDTGLGRLAANHLRAAGVDLGGVAWRSGGRMGTYYVEYAAPPRAIQVIYDRAGSCAARMSAADAHWDTLLRTRLLHLTGITPALSPGCLDLTRQAVTRARAAGVPISFDVNYRARLWGAQEAADALAPLICDVDLLFCSAGDAARLFGVSGEAGEVARALMERTRAKAVVVSRGEAGAVAWDGAALHTADALPVQMVDRLGAGDALATGVIHGWLGGDLAHGLRCGVALAALALSQFGDMVVTTQAELDALLAGGAGGLAR